MAFVKDGRIARTLAYASTLEDCYFQVQGWRACQSSGAFIMVEQQERSGKSYWVAV